MHWGSFVIGFFSFPVLFGVIALVAIYGQIAKNGWNE